MAREYERIRESVTGFCGCDICRDDVMVYALNRLKPHYVTQKKGEVLTQIDMTKDQNIADVSVGLVEGFRRVQGSPRKGAVHRAAAV